MIFFLIIILITSSFNTVLSQQNCKWDTLTNAPFLNNYKHDDIFFINKDTGWVVNGPVYTGDTGKVHKTVDGGITWDLQFQVKGSRFRSCAFTSDGNKGWVGNLGDGIFSAVTDTNIFYKTEDGGQTWTIEQNITGPKVEGICGMQYINDSTIYSIGRLYGPCRFIKTTDGGQTWTSKDMDSYAGMLIDIHFWSPDSGIVVGGTTTNYSSSKGLVLFTSNGGQTWVTKYITNATGGVCWKIDFPSKNVGYVTWETYTTPVYFLKTEDGGQTWEEKIFSNSGYQTEAIGFANDTLGWMGVRNDVSFKTEDGGDTWTQGYVGSFMNRFRFLSNDLAYASGETVYKYTCDNINSTTEINNINKKIISIKDILGREVDFKHNTLLLYIYNDGTVEKKITINK